jgi:ABC-2 type transport system permease protein/sodium transport system permease protein
MRLTLKELRETLRDRRTLITLLLMPLLVYPLLSMAFQRLLLSGRLTPDSSAPIVAFASAEQADALRPLLEQAADSWHDNAEAERIKSIQWLVPPQQDPQLDVEQAVIDGTADLGVRVHSRETVLEVELFYREQPVSLATLATVQRLLYTAQLSRLDQANLERHQAPAVPRLQLHAQPTETDGGSHALATLVPLVLILMTITGAVYPAIDLTAGERERGTLETLMAAPVPRWRLLLAKYVAVLAVAMLTAAVNLLAMTVTAYASGLSEVVFGPEGITVRMAMLVLVLLLVFSGFFAALLLAISSAARSFKEAQAYLIPLMLVALAPGLVSLIPGLRLTPPLATVPLVNIVLASRDLFQGSAQGAPVAIAFLTTVLYAVAALSLASYVFGGDALLYGSASSWHHVLRRPDRPANALHLSAAWTATAVIYPLQFLLSGMMTHISLSAAGRLFALACITALLFAALPMVIAWWQRLRVSEAMGLRAPDWQSWLAAILLGITLWPLAHAALTVSFRLGWATLDPAIIERINQMVRQWQQLPLWIIIVSLGIVPGVCEELFFRGMLFPTFRERWGTWHAVFITALLFAAFHLVAPQALAVERFLPSLTLGIVLGTLRAASGSVLPSMLAHALHNSLLLRLVPQYQEVSLAGVSPVTQWLSPVWYLLSLGTLSGWCVWLLWRYRCGLSPMVPDKNAAGGSP